MGLDGRLSLSARRAWIEMAWKLTVYPMMYVALRKESVDRNSIMLTKIVIGYVSLSARRAWIEITTYLDTSSMDDCRSPQGERG